MKSRLSALAVSILAIAAPVFAAGEIEEPSNEERLEIALEAIERERWNRAIRELQEIVQDDRQNADAWNLLGFAARNADRLDLSWDAYDRALTINPEHLGAMNYLGHLYLTKGDRASASEMVERLGATCGDCEELVELRNAMGE